MMEIATRRARRPGSLAASVIEVLDDFQCPVSTTAMRIVLNDRGRAVTAEQLGRLAAYQREDYLRTRYPPELCWALMPDGTATNPRWWARGEWRLQRRILTDDAKPIWLAILAERLCMDLADAPDGRNGAIVRLALGTIAQMMGSRYFEVPASRDEWLALRRQVYERHIGVFANLSGATTSQCDAEARLHAEGLSGFELLFGRNASTAPRGRPSV
jgi:hypothetical protein